MKGLPLVLVVALGLLASCAAPLAPTPVPDPPIAETTPHTITLSVVLGQGEHGGTAILTARVYSVVNTPVPGLEVLFTTDVGTFAPVHVVTNADGDASSTLTASQTAHVGITAGPTSTTTIVVAFPRVVPPTPLPVVPPTPPPPSAPPAIGYLGRLVAVPNPVALNAATTLTATALAINQTAPPTSYDWDCTGDGIAETTTGLNVSTCTYAALTTPWTLQLVASDLTPALGQPVTITATIRSTITANVFLHGPANASGTGTVVITVDWGAVQWQWDDTNDGTVEATIPAAGSPNARQTSYASLGAQTVHVRVTEPVSGRFVDGTLALWVGP